MPGRSGRRRSGPSSGRAPARPPAGPPAAQTSGRARTGPSAVVDSRSRADALWDALAECHRRVRAELRVVVRRHGIYLSEYRALARLREGSRKLSDLAEGLGLTPASMTDLARQLVDRGWAVRLANPQDGRSQLLQITPTGTHVYAATRGEYRGRLFDVYSALPPAGRRRLHENLEELSAVLRAREGTRTTTAASAAPGGAPRGASGPGPAGSGRARSRPAAEAVA